VSRIDFYILPGSGNIARTQFACRLAEKVWRLEKSVHIRVVDSESAKMLDDLLWTFRDGSFVPHEVLGPDPGDQQSPVTIGYDNLPSISADLLINLGDSTPENTASFPRVAEVVTADEDCRQRSRQRFVDYRDQGHTLDTHKL
jgi:DNA polymerase III subunit chi